METLNWYCVLLVLFMYISNGAYSNPAPVYGVKSVPSSKIIDNEYIIVFKNSSCNFSRITSQWKSKYGESDYFKWHDEYKFDRFAAARLTFNTTVLELLRNEPEVKHIEVNRQIWAIQDDSNPCSSLENGACMQQSTGSTLWGLSRTSMRTLTSFTSAKFNFLSGDGIGVDVYVIDTGVYADHSEFEGRAKPSFVSSELAAEGLVDQNGHGTHVSGTIAGKTYGLAKKANIIGVKVLGKDGVGTLGGLLEGLEWVSQDFQAKKSAKGSSAKGVVNLSLGGSPGEIETLDEAAITLISEGGLPFVIAAGNDNTDACMVSPGRVSVAITAGAVNKKDVLSSFSNYGPCVDILAPGEMILSSFIGSPTTTATMSGTSMSTPHVTGIVARYLSQSCQDRPTPASIKAWIQDIATKSVVDLQTKMSTPNRLLYMPCVSGSTANGPGDPNTDEASGESSSSRFTYIYIGIGVIGLLCLIVLTFTCVTYSKVKDVQDAQSRRPVRQYYQPTYQTFSPPKNPDHC